MTMDSSIRSSKCSVIPQRFVMGIMGSLAIVVSYLMRGSLTIAITEMVVPLNNTGNANVSIVCPVETPTIQNSIISKTVGTRYDWTQQQQGWIFSSFAAGYILTHIPGALLAQALGGKWVLSLGVLATIICNAAIPISIEYGGITALILLRALMGLVNGPMFPALSVLLSAWVPEKERGKLGVLVLGGGEIASILSSYVSGQILHHFTWPVVFYFWSFVAIIWFIVFTIICSSDPSSNRFIGKEELDYLKIEIGQLKRQKNLPPTPWKEIFTCAPIIVLAITQVLGDYITTIGYTYLPKYMKEVLGFSVRDIGFYISMPHVLKLIVSLLSGFVCDYLITKQYLTTTQARKLFAALASVFPAGFILAAVYAGCNRLLVVTWFILAFGFMGNFYPSFRINILDLSPNYAGPIMAVINGISSLSGIVAPNIVSMMISDSTYEQWKFVFWVSFGLAVLRTVIYTIWGSAKIQGFNEPKGFKAPESAELTRLNEDGKERKVKE